LDDTYGFGGNGVGREGCIATGPFANYTNSLGPGYENTQHCINRAINDRMSTGSAQANVDACLAMGTFDRAWPCIEGQPHSGGHGGVGGQVSWFL
jgi:tyrosinase